VGIQESAQMLNALETTCSRNQDTGQTVLIIQI
jgi:hypothetical protein